MKRSRFIPLQLALLAALTSAQAAHADAKVAHVRKVTTYTVLVGAEEATLGAGVEAFFPDTLAIHVGDTVHWQRNANEVHTVTFLAGTPLPLFNVPAPPGLPSPLMRNPLISFPTRPANGQYDGTTFANSGILGPDANQFQSFDLIFTKAGTYSYVCVVHGVRMSGQIIVVDRHAQIPSPKDVHQEARRLIAGALAQVPVAIAVGNAEVPPPTRNPDGTTTFYVLMGYSLGQLDLVRFFPEQLTVHPGDTVQWAFTPGGMLHRHTVTFLNGNPAPDDVVPVPQPDGPPLLVYNPALLDAQNPGKPLTHHGIFSSGIMLDTGSPATFSLEIGKIHGQQPYRCLLHDSSGMLGTLHIARP
jgi:plastocyanin